MAKVSIVIPCYNAGADLADAVNAARAQVGPFVDVLVVDDGSTHPGTRTVLAGCVANAVRVFHRPNLGPAAARNLGIREATGDYILPLDADDLIEPTYAAKAAAVLDARPEVGIVYCRATKFGAEQGPWDLKPYSPAEMALGNVIFATAMFRKADWAVVGGYDESLRDGMEDYDFWIRLIELGRGVVQLDEPLFHYRVSPSSRTARFEADRERVVATYAKIFRKNRDFFAGHADSLYRHRFAVYDELAALRTRLAREEQDARHELGALKAEKAEADRYNDSLQAELTKLGSAKAEAELMQRRLIGMRRRFRWLKPLWPRDGGDA